jgi:hypothetical protein
MMPSHISAPLSVDAADQEPKSRLRTAETAYTIALVSREKDGYFLCAERTGTV